MYNIRKISLENGKPTIASKVHVKFAEAKFLLGKSFNTLTDVMYSHQRNSANGRTANFPLRLGNFYFFEEINVAKDAKMFHFALYKNNLGQKAFAKAWFGTKRNTGYYWLMQEIHFVLNAGNFKKKIKLEGHEFIVRIPKVLGAYETESSLILISEYVESIINKLNNKVYILVLNEVFKYIGSLKKGINTKDSISKITPLRITLSIPALMLTSIIRKPFLWKHLLVLIPGFIRDIPELFASDWNSLAHRDLKESILLGPKNTYYIIDWQTIAFTHPFMDLVQLIFTHWNEIDPFVLLKTSMGVTAFSSKRNKAVLRILSIYVLLIEISVVGTRQTEEEIDFLNFIKSISHQAGNIRSNFNYGKLN